MVVSLSNKNRPHIPPPLQGLTRVEEMTMPGVTFTHTLSFAPHILKVTSKADASLYAFKTLMAYATSRRQHLLHNCYTQVQHIWSGVHQSGWKSPVAVCSSSSSNTKRQLYCRVISRCGCYSCAEESYAVLTTGNKIVQCGEIKTWCVIIWD